MMSVRPNASGNVIYGLRKDDPSLAVMARGEEIIIYAPSAVTMLSRKDARLLAKRINQCLDDTRKV